jgi:hypothetical protein
MNTEPFTVVHHGSRRYLDRAPGLAMLSDDDLDAFRGIALGIVVGAAFWALVALVALAAIAVAS